MTDPTSATSPANTPAESGSIWPSIRQFGKQSAVYALGTIAARLVGFVLIPLYTEHLPLGDYGVIALLVLVTQAVSAVAGLGLMNSMFRLWPEARDDTARRRLFSTVVLSQASAAALLLACVRIDPGWWSATLLGSTEWGAFVLIAVATGLSDMVLTTPLGVLRLKERAGHFVAAMLVRAAVSMGVAVYLVGVLRMGIAGVLWANLAGALATLAVLAPVFARYLRPSFDVALAKELLPFGLWYMVGVTAGMFYGMGDRYVLKYLLGLSAVGIYGVGHQLATSVNMLGQSFISAYLPMGLNRGGDAEGGRFVTKSLTYFAIGLTWVALGFSLLSEEIVLLLASRPDYYAAWQVVPLLAFGFVLYALIGGVEIGFYFAGIARYNTWVIIGALALNIGLNFILIPTLGILGAALAAATASAARLALSYYWAQRLHPLPWEVRRIVHVLLLAGAYHAALLISGGFWTVVLAKSAIAFTFPAALWVTGLLTPHERSTIRAFVGRLAGR